MSSTNTNNFPLLDPVTVRQALAAERMRGRRCQNAWMNAKGKKLKGQCSRELAASVGRAAELAIALVDMGQAVPMLDVCADFDGRLLDAMDSTLRRAPTFGFSVPHAATRRRQPVRAHGRIVHG